jgi:hypothetical protein
MGINSFNFKNCMGRDIQFTSKTHTQNNGKNDSEKQNCMGTHNKLYVSTHTVYPKTVCLYPYSLPKTVCLYPYSLVKNNYIEYFLKPATKGLLRYVFIETIKFHPINYIAIR